jgi:hypothetical protein
MAEADVRQVLIFQATPSLPAKAGNPVNTGSYWMPRLRGA